MAPPSLTVLITTYNYGKFVEQAIESVLEQDFPLDQLQVVVVDDGSTDDTAERVIRFGTTIEYFYKSNGGQASALNLGFAKARGEIIALLDADDFCLPGKLTRIAKAFQENPQLGMIYHRLREWHAEIGTYTDLDFHPVSGDVREKPDFFLSYVPHPTSAIAFRRSSLAPFLPIPEEIRMLADCYPVSLMPFCAPVFAIPEFLTMYRIHGNNSYYANGQRMPPKIAGERFAMWENVIAAMSKWLVEHEFSRRQLPVRDFLNLWYRHQQKNRFQMNPPSRFRFFRFVLWDSCSNSARQSWKFTLFNCLTAFSALAFGYERSADMDKWRGRALASVERRVRTVFGRRSQRSNS